MSAHPGALELSCDIRETQTIGELLQHIVAVELRYAERLAGQTPTDYKDIPSGSVIEIYKVHDRAMRVLDRLEQQHDSFWDAPMVFATRSAGQIHTTRRVAFIHLMMHSVRHYAQLATLIRKHGIKADWDMDFLFADAAVRSAPQETPASQQP